MVVIAIKFSYRGLASRELCAFQTHVVKIFNMADDNIEEGETSELSSLALDSNKQKEFEDKVKRIRAQVSTKLGSIRNISLFHCDLLKLKVISSLKLRKNQINQSNLPILLSIVHRLQYR